MATLGPAVLDDGGHIEGGGYWGRLTVATGSDASPVIAAPP
jgi:hypothetical protein